MAKVKGIKQIWFVSPIVVESDPNKPMQYPLANGNQDVNMVEEAQPRRGNSADTSSKDYGFSLMRNNVITMAWQSKAAANAYAKELASKNPKVAYGVYSCVDVFETTAPEVIEKQFNDAGELVVCKTEV